MIDSTGEQLGVVDTKEALARSELQGLDLVEVAPEANPPVCRIMDYGKYKYRLSKKAKQAKKKQHVVQVKEIKMRPKIDTHDFNFKCKHIESFLGEGNKVKVTVRFKGRELAHPEFGEEVLERVKSLFETQALVESPPKMEGKLMQMILAPSNQKVKTPKKENPNAENQDA